MENQIELIQFYPHNYENYWPGLDPKAGGYPYINLRVMYLENGCMILKEVGFERREWLLFDYAQYNLLVEEVSNYIAEFNTVGIWLL